MFSKSVVLVVLVLATSAIVSAFPDGAPADTCVNANSPKHGKTLPRANHTLPYQLVASSDQFGPGAEVQGEFYLFLFQRLCLNLFFISFTVSIYGRDTFRGFFLQARNGETDEWIGEWEQTDNTNVIPECSAITHGDNRDKLQAVLVWKAPNNRQGYVYFT